jgi:hypothetical protein
MTTQVSMNIEDWRVAPLATSSLASRPRRRPRGVAVDGSELWD